MIKNSLTRNISPNILKTAILIFIGVAVINSIIFGVVEFKQSKRLILRDFRFIALAVNRSLAEAIWQSDKAEMNQIVNELMTNFNISGVKILNYETNYTEISKIKSGRSNSIPYTYDITYTYDKKQIQLARLYLYTDYSIVFFRTKRVIGLLLLKTLLETITIVILLFWGFKRVFLTYLIRLQKSINIEKESQQKSLLITERDFRDVLNRLLSQYFKKKEIQEESKATQTEEHIEEKSVTVSTMDLYQILELANPSKDVIEKFFAQHFILSQSAEKERGDIYLFVEIEKNREILLLIVDYGNINGLNGIEITLILKDIEKELLIKYNTNNRLFALSKILEFTDRKIRSRFTDNGKNILDEVEFKGLAMVYDKVNNSIEYSSKGILILKSENNKFITYDDYGSYNDRVMQHGAIERKKEHIIQSVKNKTFYIVTDGFFKQVKRDKNREEIGKKGFMEILDKVSKTNFKSQKESFLDEFNNIKGEKPQTDSVTVIGLKI